MTLDNEIRSKYIVEGLSIEKISEDLDVSVKYIEKLLSGIKITKRSSMETTILEVLKDIYPLYKIEEQIYIDGLFLDFYVTNIRLGIETDGKQHSEIIKHWHGSGAQGANNFYKGLLRDQAKEKYLRDNNIHLIRISYKEKIDFNNIRRILNENNQQIMDNLAKYNSTIRL